MKVEVTNAIKYIGVDDKTIDLFESQYAVSNGVSYNSYLIEDEKIVVMDTVDKRKQNEWLCNLEKELNGKKIDYLVISHLEPDHSACINTLIEKYPTMKLVGNAMTFKMLPQFFDVDVTDRQVVVKEGDTLNIGKHTLQFFMAPMVHWPEVMVTYEQTEKVLFTADGFGKFGTLDVEEDWSCEARRYYFNIVGKYGIQVQTLLKKVSTLDIKIICPLHGPILKENLEYYINKYDIWSSYKPEDEGILIAYNSIHGNTANAIKILEQILIEEGEKKVIVSDLARKDMAEVVENAFHYDKMIVASPTYDAGLFPFMEKFLRSLKHKNYQNRTVGIIENGSWAPSAAKNMKELLEQMKEITIVEPIIHIKTTMSKENEQEMRILAKEILKK
jgi:flavorubredoxin